ncbi:GIY-YIG nuclease family protein [Echinicola salinicaeni]|uniref:GIY-YIG nuclease family protein n=1 Tax=Echinicola salinicaeni TaxID=2762757 RepID=UPI00293BBAFD|nr:GIY-YIG nuclease family protein [Echinicola salinicaeni]
MQGFSFFNTMENFYVYIIYSRKIDKFYTGQTQNIDKRLQFHNDPDKFTNTL